MSATRESSALSIRIPFVFFTLIAVFTVLSFVIDQTFQPSHWLQENGFTVISVVEQSGLFFFCFFLFTYNRIKAKKTALSWSANAAFCAFLFGFPITIFEMTKWFPSFFWSRTIGYVIACSILSLIWFPSVSDQSRWARRLPWLSVLALVIVIVLSVAFSDQFPPSTTADGKYVLSYRLLNILCGAGLLANSFFFLSEAKADIENSLLLRALGLYFATNGLGRIFLGFGERWSLYWWSLPVLRIFATVISLYFVLKIFIETLNSSVCLNQSLDSKNKELETKNQQILGQQKDIEMQRAKAFHAARMASIGKLAGTVAHEINNPLAIINMNAEMALATNSEGQGIVPVPRERLETILKTVSRIKGVVNSALSLAREAKGSPSEPASLPQIVHTVLDVCSQKFSDAGIRLTVAEIPKVDLFCKKIQIEQVLLNLLMNAFDATENRPDPWVQIEFAETDRDGIIKITDSGAPIPPDVASRMMEPFFTTKDVNKGVGLGLSIAKALIEEHDGHLAYRPENGRTCFVMGLPKIDCK